MTPNYWYNSCPGLIWQCSSTAAMTRNCSFLEFLCFSVGSGWHKSQLQHLYALASLSFLAEL